MCGCLLLSVQITLLNHKIAQGSLIIPGITTVTPQNLNTPIVQTVLSALSPITVDAAAIACGGVLLALQALV